MMMTYLVEWLSGGEVEHSESVKGTCPEFAAEKFCAENYNLLPPIPIDAGQSSEITLRITRASFAPGKPELYTMTRRFRVVYDIVKG